MSLVLGTVTHLIPALANSHLALPVILGGAYDTTASLGEQECDRVFSFQPVLKTKSFEIRKFKSPNGKWLVAKCPRKLTARNCRSLRQQYFALRELNRRMHGPSGESIPLPIFLSEDETVLVMSHVEGISLNSILRSKANLATGWRQFHTLRERGKAVGRWLKKFHVTTASQPQPHIHLDYRNEMQEAYATSRALGISEALIIRVREVQERLSSSQENASVGISSSHGDFLPQNILIHGTDVGVVDFGTFNSAYPIHYDIATFLAYVGLLAGKLKYSRTALIALADGFLSGYGNGYNLQLLQSELLNSTIRLVYDSNSENVSPLSRRRVERVLTEALERILSDPNSTQLF